MIKFECPCKLQGVLKFSHFHFLLYLVTFGGHLGWSNFALNEKIPFAVLKICSFYKSIIFVYIVKNIFSGSCNSVSFSYFIILWKMDISICIIIFAKCPSRHPSGHTRWKPCFNVDGMLGWFWPKYFNLFRSSWDFLFSNLLFLVTVDTKWSCMVLFCIHLVFSNSETLHNIILEVKFENQWCLNHLFSVVGWHTIHDRWQTLKSSVWH